MYIQIDFNSEEALYIQLKNQIILAIATSQVREGESLPSVRVLADSIGINMHTVNKAYNILKDDGFVRVDRRRGVVVSVNMDKIRTISALNECLKPLLTAAVVKGVSRDEVKAVVDDIYDELS